MWLSAQDSRRSDHAIDASSIWMVRAVPDSDLARIDSCAGFFSSIQDTYQRRHSWRRHIRVECDSGSYRKHDAAVRCDHVIGRRLCAQTRRINEDLRPPWSHHRTFMRPSDRRLSRSQRSSPSKLHVPLDPWQQSHAHPLHRAEEVAGGPRPRCGSDSKLADLPP